MVESLNLNNLTVDENGRIAFSGLSSGIDFRTAVDTMTAVKRIPIDLLENRITDNTDKIAALKSLRTQVETLKSSLDSLRGAVTFQDSGDIFSAKQTFASTSRGDGQSPSSAANLVGVSVTNAAAAGIHTVEVRQVAAAHKISTSTFSSQSTALNVSGAFEISGIGGTSSITIATTDTLQGVRDKINAANTGTSATKVTASVVQISSSQFVLVMTADEPGSDMIITDDTATILSGLGISATNGEGAFRNGVTTNGASKITTALGFDKIIFDGTQADEPFQITYAAASDTFTMTKLSDGTTDTAVFTGSVPPASGATETLTFSDFGAKIIIDENFTDADIVADANTATIDGGTAVINTISITGSTGDISGITDTRMLLTGIAAAPSSTTITTGTFTGSFTNDTGVKTVTLTDSGNSANTITIQFTVGTAFNGSEANTTSYIDMQSLENTVGATASEWSNELLASESARFTADGLADADRYESDLAASATTPFSSLLSSSTTYPASFDITVGSNTVSVTGIVNTDTLTQLAADINTAISGSGGTVESSGTTASIVTSNGGARLVITNTDGSAITLTDTTGILNELGMDNDLVIERTSNTVTDLFTGVTLSLFAAEEGTTIKLEVDEDLSAIQTAIQNFVDAYNALKQFINSHRLVDSETGAKSEDAGILFDSQTVRQIEQRLGNIVGRGLSDEDSSLTYRVLAEIGIEFVDNATLDDPLLEDNLAVNTSTLDEKLLNNLDDVRKLFAFDFSPGNADITLIDFTGDTTYKAAGYTLNLTSNGSTITGADIDGSDTATVVSNIITVTSGDATGLKVLYTGDTTVGSAITIDFTTGLGANLFFETTQFLDLTDGLIEADLDGLDDANVAIQDRVDLRLVRLDLYRQNLLDRFITLETILARAATVRSTITQITDGMFNNR